MNLKNIEISSNRNFGIVFFVFFMIISIFPLFEDGYIRVWAVVIAMTFLTLGLLNSSVLSPLNKIWFKFGILLGNFMSPIIMGLIFFTVVTPIAFLLKAFGKDVLKLKKNNEKSYWIEKSLIKSKMKNQF